MRLCTWMVAAGAFLFGLPAMIGCGTSPPPEKPGEPAKSDPQQSTPPGFTPNVTPVNLVHEFDPSRHRIPAGMVLGSTGDATFAPQALIEGDYLVFRTLKMGTSQIEREIKLKLGSVSDLKSFENKKMSIRQDMPVSPEVPEIWFTTPSRGVQLFPNGYALTLELGTRQDWQIVGKVYLCLPDPDKTVLAGGFIAAFPRQVTEQPGIDDLPYIKGAVNVIGAAPGTKLRVGFAANPNEKTLPMGLAEIDIGEPAEPIRWTRSDMDKPPVTTLIAGDGKKVPSRYELSRLFPGRYIVFATLSHSDPAEPPGPVVWKWVTVKPGEALAADLAIDTAQTGGLEIDIPEDSIERVELVPSDGINTQSLQSIIFTAYSLHLGLERPVIAHKAVYKKLAPGVYDVRAGLHVSSIEIVAGKTTELNFNKKPASPAKTETVPEPKPKQ